MLKLYVYVRALVECTAKIQSCRSYYSFQTHTTGWVVSCGWDNKSFGLLALATMTFCVHVCEFVPLFTVLVRHTIFFFNKEAPQKGKGLKNGKKSCRIFFLQIIIIILHKVNDFLRCRITTQPCHLDTLQYPYSVINKGWHGTDPWPTEFYLFQS